MKKIFFLVALLAASCNTLKQQDDTDQITTGDLGNETTDAQSSEILATERPVYWAAETIFTDLIHTKLEVSFDWNKAQMTGKETLTAKPHFYSTNQLVLDAKGMQINGVSMNGKTRPFTYEKDVLTIELDLTYARTQEYTVVIDYIAKPEERVTVGSDAITSDKGLYFINPRGEEPHKMPQIWTQGETEASSVWFPTIDAPNVKTTQEIFITVADKYATLSNGKLLESKKNADGTRTDHWKQDLPHAPYLFMMAVGEYKIVKDSYKRPDGTLMEVNYYVEPEWEPYAKDIFGETPKMIGFFSQLLGVDYVWDKYHQIIVREYVSGAMENTGAVIFGDYAYKTRRELLDENDNSTIAHELFHHWFGDLVTAESWSNLTLNESFANYSQYLWDEYRYGLDQADYNANGEMQGYFQSASVAGYHDLFWTDYKSQEDMFDGHSYNKGGRILHMLRNYLGDEAFFAGIQLYLKTNSFKAAEFHQLRLAFESVSGQDLNWFFDQWYENAGHPELAVSYQINATEKKVFVTMEQKQQASFGLFKLPLEITVFDDRGATPIKIEFDRASMSAEIPYIGTLNNVLFDSQAMLLGEVNEKKEASWYIHQYYNAKRWRARNDALNYGTRTKTPESAKLILDALDDPFWDIRLTAIEKVITLSGINKELAIGKLNKMVVSDPSSAVRSSVLSALVVALDATTVQPILEGRIQQDSSYMVISNALNQLSKIDSPTAMKLAKPLEKERSSTLLSGIAGLYSQNGTAANFAFYERIFTTNVLGGFDELSALNAFTYYLSTQELSVIQKSVPIFEDRAKNGGAYTKMYLSNFLTFLNKTLDDNSAVYKEEENKAKQSGNTNGVDIAKAKQADAKALIATFQGILAKLESEE